MLLSLYYLLTHANNFFTYYEKADSLTIADYLTNKKLENFNIIIFEDNTAMYATEIEYINNIIAKPK
jgi:hypothetical protein